MSSAPLVHAVVVHQRGRGMLSRCLESLLASRGVDLRVAVVANACLEPMPAIAEADARVSVLRSAAPLGFAVANNRGATLLRERAGPPSYLYFLNDDTESEPGALLALVGHMQQRPACAAAGPRLMIDGPGDWINSLGLELAVTGEAWDQAIGRRLDECGPLPAVRPVLAVTGSALLIRESVFARLGGWAEIFHFYYEDVDLCLRARSFGGDVEVVTGAVVRHAVSATARGDSEFKRYHILRTRLLLLAAHWPFGLLVRVLPRILALESGRFLVRLGRGAWGLAWTQTRAWAGFLRRLPAAAGLRARRGPERGWISFLKPPGAIPAVHLPEAGAGA